MIRNEKREGRERVSFPIFIFFQMLLKSDILLSVVKIYPVEVSHERRIRPFAGFKGKARGVGR